MSSPLLNKSLDFATRIVLFYENFSKAKRDTTIAKNFFVPRQSLVQILTKPNMASVRRISYQSFIFLYKKPARVSIG